MSIRILFIWKASKCGRIFFFSNSTITFKAYRLIYNERPCTSHLTFSYAYFITLAIHLSILIANHQSYFLMHFRLNWRHLYTFSLNTFAWISLTRVEHLWFFFLSPEEKLDTMKCSNLTRTFSLNKCWQMHILVQPRSWLKYETLQSPQKPVIIQTPEAATLPFSF